MKGHVLIVDDDKTLVDYINSFLESNEYQVSTRNECNWGDIIHKVDMVLLDYHMPRKDGLLVLQEMRQQRAGLPIIMMTGERDQLIAIQSFRDGAIEFLQKPIHLPFLYTILEAVIHKEELNTLKQARRMAEEKSRLKSEFLADMSHEIRSPLNSIVGFLRQLEDDLKNVNMESERESEINESLSFMSQGASRLTKLINGLLDLSKLEAGKVEFRFQANDLLAIIISVVGELTPQAKEKGIEIGITNDDHLEFAFDGGKITQVLVNLIGNAIKFAPENGQVAISFAITTLAGKQAVTISVTNSGECIADEQLSNIFDRFIQEGHQRGTGLGLAISQEIVSGHNGKIGAEKVETGAKFTLTLPFHQDNGEENEQ